MTEGSNDLAPNSLLRVYRGEVYLGDEELVSLIFFKITVELINDKQERRL